MKKNLNSIVAEMFENRVSFSNTFGTEKLMDANYMLVTDVLSENLDMFSSLVQEHLQEKKEINLKNQTNNYIHLAS